MTGCADLAGLRVIVALPFHLALLIPPPLLLRLPLCLLPGRLPVGFALHVAVGCAVSAPTISFRWYRPCHTAVQAVRPAIAYPAGKTTHALKPRPHWT